jgi:hypothetical protein
VQDLIEPVDVEQGLDSLRKHPAIKPVLIVIGMTVGLMTLATMITDVSQIVDKFSGFAVLLMALAVLALTVVVFMTTFLAAASTWKGRNSILATQISNLERVVVPDDTHQRYEDIQASNIRLGWIPFYPTLIERSSDGKIVGPGPAILKTVFEGRTQFHPTSSGWDDVFNSLNNHEFDVVVTPMYDIKERRAHVEFTSPIFYADIGLFASVDNEDVKTALSGRQRLEFREAIKLLSSITPKLQFCAHRGELQDKMVTKHFPGAKIGYAKSERFSVYSALNAMVTRPKGYTSDLYFCERILGEGHEQYTEKKKIYNVFAPGQLLFPVAFALRRGDDTLRKFINLRLMTIDGERSSGIRDHLVDHSQGILDETLIRKIDEYFLRKRGPVKQDEPEVLPNILPFTG